MAEQIVAQPDGKLSVYSSISGGFTITDATPDELIEIYANEAAGKARKHISRVVGHVLAGTPEVVYRNTVLTWEEAHRRDLDDGMPEEEQK